MASVSHHDTVWKLYGWSPCYVKKEADWDGFLWIPGREAEPLALAHINAGMSSVDFSVSDLSFYRLIPGQSSKAAQGAVTTWKPIKCSWAYFGSGMKKEHYPLNRPGHRAVLTSRATQILASSLQASLTFLIFCKNWRKMWGETFFRHLVSIFFLSYCQWVCRSLAEVITQDEEVSCLNVFPVFSWQMNSILPSKFAPKSGTV